MIRKAVTWIGLIVLAALAAPDQAFAQCAMCRQALASPEGQQLLAALRRGILVLLAAPFMLFAIVAVAALRAQLKRRQHPSETA